MTKTWRVEIDLPAETPDDVADEFFTAIADLVHSERWVYLGAVMTATKEPRWADQ